MRRSLKKDEKELLAKSALFAGILPEEMPEMLEYLCAGVRSYQKEETVFRAGEPAWEMGLVLSGAVRMEENDIWGNRSIIGSARQGQVFAETYACSPGEPLMVDVIAAQPSEILFFQIQRIIHFNPSGPGFDGRLLRNLVGVLAEKNLGLTRKIRFITPKSLRARILAYLSFEARQQGSGEVELPFNRQQMADYLNADRSALSGELSKMQKEGLVEYRRNHFLLHAGQPEGGRSRV